MNAGRRLKTGVLLGAAMLVDPVISKVNAGQKLVSRDPFSTGPGNSGAGLYDYQCFNMG